MLTVCHAAKGGQGVTTVTAALAVIEDWPMVIDAAGDLPAVLGLPEPAGPNLARLLEGDGPLDAGTIAEAAEVTPDRGRAPAKRRCVPHGASGPVERIRRRPCRRSAPLAGRRRHRPGDCHAGCRGSTLLVTRNCYLALRRATEQLQRGHRTGDLVLARLFVYMRIHLDTCSAVRLATASMARHGADVGAGRAKT